MNDYPIRTLSDVGAENAAALVVDISGEPKPRSHVSTTKYKVTFTLFRRAKCPVSRIKAGEWQPITRTHTASAKRIATCKKIMGERKAEAQEIYAIAQWANKYEPLIFRSREALLLGHADQGIAMVKEVAAVVKEVAA